jgi:prenyltransferase beta subunit
MAKKANTLNDLTSFLKSDSIIGSTEFISEVEQDFFTKKPLTLVDVHAEVLDEVVPLTKEKKIVTTDKSKKWTLEELQNALSTYAKENNVSVDEVVSKLTTKQQTQTEVNPFLAYFNWTIDLQVNYFQFLLDFQRRIMKN